MNFTEQDIINFVYREARLLDELRFEDWLSLFAPDGIYWMPLDHEEVDPKLVTTLFYDDLLLLRTRVRRLLGSNTFSQQPRSRCHHLLQQPQIDRFDPAAGEFVTWTSFTYTETRLGRTEHYSGWMTHHLVIHNEELRIRLKKVHLVNCDAPHRNIQLLM